MNSSQEENPDKTLSERQAPEAQPPFIASFISTQSPNSMRRRDPLEDWRRNSVCQITASKHASILSQIKNTAHLPGGDAYTFSYDRLYEESAYKLYKQKIKKLEEHVE